MRRRIKKSTKQYIMVALICIAVIGGAAVTACIMFHNQISQKFGTLLDSALEELELNQRSVYVATKDINISEPITKDNVTYKKVFTSQPSYLYLTEEDIGKVARLDIKEGTQVLSSMVSDMIDNNLREVCFRVITLNKNLFRNDTVDIRIFYPNGENYIVLGKKLIKNELVDSETYLWLSEEEILRMSSAIIDAYLYEGTILYATKYIEPMLQDESIITYTPSLVALELISTNPNILEIASYALSANVRKSMENRLAHSMNMDVSSIEWKVDKNEDSTWNLSNEQSNNEIIRDEDGFVYFSEEENAKENEYEFGE